MAVFLKKTIAKNLKIPQASFGGWLVNQFFKRKNVVLEKNAVRLCEIEPDHKVLEVGFGPGVGLEAAYEHVKGGTGKVYGVELSLYMINEAQKRLKQQIHDNVVDITFANVTQLPFNTDTFDRIFHCNSYYFWTPLHVAACELYRVMKPGGYMVTTLNLASLKIWEAKGWLKYGQADPLNYMMALENAGFQDIKLEHITDKGFKYQAIFAYIREKTAIEDLVNITDIEQNIKP